MWERLEDLILIRLQYRPILCYSITTLINCTTMSILAGYKKIDNKVVIMYRKPYWITWCKLTTNITSVSLIFLYQREWLLRYLRMGQLMSYLRLNWIMDFQSLLNKSSAQRKLNNSCRTPFRWYASVDGLISFVFRLGFVFYLFHDIF